MQFAVHVAEQGAAEDERKAALATLNA